MNSCLRGPSVQLSPRTHITHRLVLLSAIAVYVTEQKETGITTVKQVNGILTDRGLLQPPVASLQVPIRLIHVAIVEEETK